MSLKYNGRIIPLAKQLRSNQTPQERKLWYDYLTNYPIRFQWQKVIGYYIADFYCSKAKLVIELDGSQHFTEEGEDNDKIRTEILSQNGLKIIRFANNDVTNNFEGVCEVIDYEVKERLQFLGKTNSLNAR